MARISQLAEADLRTQRVATSARRAAGGSPEISATMQDGATVVRLPDRSTLAFVGTVSPEQLTFLGWNRTRPTWRVIRSH